MPLIENQYLKTFEFWGSELFVFLT